MWPDNILHNVDFPLPLSPIKPSISLFLRDTDLRDANITRIELGYYPEINQIDENVLSGEAIPVWRIIVEEDAYLYNAYVGSKIE